MKILIWIISAFVIVLANELLGSVIGFKLGYVIVFLLISAVSTALTKAFLGEEAAGKKKNNKGGNPAPGVLSAPVPGGWTCPQCGMHHIPEDNFCDNCGIQKVIPAPQAPAREATRPQPAPAEPPRPKFPDYEMTQPENVIRQAPAAPAQPVYQPFQDYGTPPHPSSQPPAPQQNAAIKFYVSSLNTEVNVTRASFTVGRDATSDLNLARLPNAKYIARRQASFFCSGGKWYIRDENSTNGTFLNNRRLPGGQPQTLNKGDFISFAGKETLIVQDLK